MSPSQLLLRGGLVFDGTGAPPLHADVLIEGTQVARIAPHGSLGELPQARQIDVSGCWVTPGFVDTHTHYDAEVALSPGLVESVRHGVTTVVLGSCSVSFVSAEPEDCADLFTRVEAVPREVVLPLLRELKTWSRPQGWRDWIDGHPLGPNVASFLGHSDLRCAVMGLQRSVATSQVPSPQEQQAMEALLEEALDCGFLGLSSMTNPWDKLDGDRAWSKPLPSVFARGRERRGLMAILRRRGFIHQSAPNLVTRVNVLGMIAASAGLGRKALKTTIITMMDLKADRYVYRLTDALARIANGLLRADFRWQSPPVPFDLYYDGMDSVLFEEFPTGEMIRDLARDPKARVDTLRDPVWRARFHKELHRKLSPKVWHRDLDDAVILAAPDASLVGRSFTEVATARGADPVDTFLDLMAQYDRELRWHTCLANDRPEVLERIMDNPGTLMSFADSGAHLRNMAFYNFPVRMLKRVHDAAVAGRPFMSLERAVYRLTGEPAAWFGLDAGTLREGGRADIAVVDPSRLDERVERVRLAPFDVLPGFERLVNEGDAVRHVFVAGQEVTADGEPLPGLGSRRTGTFLEARP